MNAGAGSCNPDLVMRYMDQELSARERAEMDRHLDRCPKCREALQESQRLSAAFQRNMDHAVGAASLDRVEEAVLARIRTQDRKQTAGAGAGTGFLFWKRALVPAAILAVAVVLFFSFFSPFQQPLEPSAIINSFTAETSSVMILETPETHRTILWFEEKQGQGGENDGMQQA
jgi:anti-sigma factor RsiW